MLQPCSIKRKTQRSSNQPTEKEGNKEDQADHCTCKLKHGAEISAGKVSDIHIQRVEQLEELEEQDSDEEAPAKENRLTNEIDGGAKSDHGCWTEMSTPTPIAFRMMKLRVRSARMRFQTFILQMRLIGIDDIVCLCKHSQRWRHIVRRLHGSGYGPCECSS